MGSSVDRRDAIPGTARTNTRLQARLDICSRVTSLPQSVIYSETKYLRLGAVYVGSTLSTNGCYGSYPAATRQFSSLSEASRVNRIRSIAIQLRKYEITDLHTMRVAYDEKPDIVWEEVMTPLMDLLAHSITENMVKFWRAGGMHKGVVSAYQATILEFRQLMEEDRNKAKAVWSIEEREFPGFCKFIR